MPLTDPVALVPLAGGLVLPAAVISRMLELEDRGIQLRRNDSGQLVATPRQRLTPDDDAFLRGHRDEVLVAIAYIAGLALRVF